ncbi:MAG: PD40 domain-containing protein [Phycisphaerae bacterium]|nr:PD40 domain-containing protein [Phycisphaerae bacterium]
MRTPLACIAIAALAASSAAAGAATPGLIAFCSNRSGQWGIWTLRADGSDLKQVSKAPAGAHDVDPVFSPDGRGILFTSTRGGKAGVWRMGADGSKPKRICDGDQAEWSPDGKKIVFRRAERIVVRELATGKDRTVSPKGLPRCGGPAWGPDGKSIAMAARDKGGNAIYIVPAEGGKARKVYDKKGACEPHWSPDGKLLVYETETHICTIRPDGSKNRLVTWFGGVQRYGRFSPDGKRIVFCQGASERGPWELYVIPAGGGTPRKLTEGGSDMHPDWQPPPRPARRGGEPKGAAR